MTASFMSRWRVYKKGGEGERFGNAVHHSRNSPRYPTNQNDETRRRHLCKTTSHGIRIDVPEEMTAGERKALQERNNDREKRLTKILSKYPNNIAKWNYPTLAMQVIEEARRDASKYHDRISRDLTAALEWPTPEMAEENYFYEAKDQWYVQSKRKLVFRGRLPLL
jgi:hypothetical protein